MGTPFFSVKSKTLGTDGDSFTNVFIFEEDISIMFEDKCLAA
jgi:hypothetical protein